MELGAVAELQVLLEGVELPSEKPDLLRYAARQGATPAQLGMLDRLTESSYETIDEVAEELVRVQPERGHEVPHTPREESGEPPGGDAYTQKRPRSGAVRS